MAVESKVRKIILITNLIGLTKIGISSFIAYAYLACHDILNLLFNIIFL